jgi:hypothetical protein
MYEDDTRSSPAKPQFCSWRWMIAADGLLMV